jgi:hypothetical protein
MAGACNKAGRGIQSSVKNPYFRSTKSGDARAGPIHSRTFTGTSGGSDLKVTLRGNV